jgi:hypothetical protein
VKLYIVWEPGGGWDEASSDIYGAFLDEGKAQSLLDAIKGQFDGAQILEIEANTSLVETSYTARVDRNGNLSRGEPSLCKKAWLGTESDVTFNYYGVCARSFRSQEHADQLVRGYCESKKHELEAYWKRADKMAADREKLMHGMHGIPPRED